MAPGFTTTMGLAFDTGDPISQSKTMVAGRDRQGPQGLSKAERLLGVSDTAGLPHTGSLEWRPRQRKLRNMGSNLSLLTDIKRAISGSNPRSASRSANSPNPYPAADLRRTRTGGSKLETDQRSIRSDAGDYGRSPTSAGTTPGYNYKQSLGSPVASAEMPRMSEAPAPEKSRIGKYTQDEQEKIMNNLVRNGMMVDSEKRPREKKSRTGKSSDGRATAQKHSRGNSGASKESNAASSKYSQDQDGVRYSQSRKGSSTSNPQASDETPQRRSGRKSSQILSPQLASQAPGIRISRIPSPEGERIRTWLTYTDASSEAAQNARADWLSPARLETLPESQSSTSVHTMTSLETGPIFPIQGGPDDWSTIRRHSRQSSMLTKTELPADVPKGAASKSGKVYYTDLQVESVLALSSSDSESDAESESSALARRRLSLMSNGNETQPTAWSSTASSRSQSRKMSVNTYATSPQRHSFSSDQWNYPMPNAHVAVLSREPSASKASHDSGRAQQPVVQTGQLSPVHRADHDVGLLGYTPNTEDTHSLANYAAPGSQTVDPMEPHGSQLTCTSLTAQEDFSNPLHDAIRAEGRARKNSAVSQSKLHGFASSPAQPAPTKPLPIPPIQGSAVSTPTIQTPSGDDDSSIFSFPKPPRVLKKSGSRSADPSSPSSEPTTPGETHTPHPESGDSDGSNDTVRPSIHRKPSNLSILSSHDDPAAASSASNVANFLSPDAAYGNTPYVLEEFSPIVLGFPEHVHQQMDDNTSPHTLTHSTSNPSGDLSASSEMGLGTAVSTNEEPQYEMLRKPLELEIPRAGTFELIQPPSGMRSAPLAIKTDLSPVAEGPRSTEAVQTAPPSVQTHWEKAMATNFPSIPLPQVAQRPMRRFHLPTTSTASTMTSRSSPSPRMRDADFEPPRVAVGPGVPVAVGGIGIARSGSPGGMSVNRGHMRTPTGSGGSVGGRGTPPPNTTATRGYRTSKRISTGKGIEPLRLSRIGNAV